MGEKARAFLIEKFTEGASGGQKADANQVAKEMKVLRGKDGNLLFQPEEWRTAKQISSFFSRFAALQRRTAGESDKELDEEDLLAIENEEAMQTLHEAVIEDMEGPDHPIIVNGFNICELSRTSKLNKLKVTQLRDICAELHLPTPGHQNWKSTFTDPLLVYSNKCSCYE